MTNYFDILGIKPTSNLVDIKKAYKNKKAEINANRYIHVPDKQKKLLKLKKAYRAINNKYISTNTSLLPNDTFEYSFSQLNQRKHNTNLFQSFNSLFPFELNQQYSNSSQTNYPKNKKSYFYQSSTSSVIKSQPDGTFKMIEKHWVNDNGKVNKKEKHKKINKFGEVIKSIEE